MHYFKRRARRIYPPYWIVLFITLGVVAIVDMAVPDRPLTHHGFYRPWWFSPSQWVGNITLTETWRFHLGGSAPGWMVEPAWTLCYEEQFYLVAGLLLAVAPTYYFQGAAIVTLVVAACAFLAGPLGLPVSGFFIDGAWVQFALGVLVYYAQNYCSMRGRVVSATALLALAIAAAWHPAALLNPTARNPNVLYFAAACFALVLMLLHPFDQQIARAKWLEPLRLPGTMCYSLYLVHAPLIGLIYCAIVWFGGQRWWTPEVAVPVASAICIAVSWRFHVSVERRFLNAPIREVPSVPVAAL